MQYTHRRTPDSFYTTSAGIRQARGLDGKCQMVNHLTGAITDYTYGRTRPNSTAARPAAAAAHGRSLPTSKGTTN